MFNKKLKLRIKNLEILVEKQRQMQFCSEGYHRWELCNKNTKNPCIICSVCGAPPLSKKI